MKLIERISSDFVTAFKNREMAKKDTLAVLKTEVTRESKTPEDASVIADIKSLIKNGKKEPVSITDEELAIYEAYLPKQMSADELTNLVKTFISENSLSGKGDMGKVMGFLKGNFDGQYDGKSASGIVISNL